MFSSIFLPTEIGAGDHFLREGKHLHEKNAFSVPPKLCPGLAW